MASLANMLDGWGPRPQFEVLWPVVVADAIAMVHGLTVQQVPPEAAA